MGNLLKTLQELGPLGTVISATILAVVACFSIFATTAYVDAKHDGVMAILTSHGQALEKIDGRLWDMQGRPRDEPPVRLPAASPLPAPGN